MLKMALKASGRDHVDVVHRPSAPRLLRDNGPSYISGDLAIWLEDHEMDHVRGALNHPQTQGKTERWHQTLKNRILLENDYRPGDLEGQIATTKAWEISPPPTSTSGAIATSSNNERKSRN